MEGKANAKKQIGRIFVSESRKMGIVLRIFSGASAVFMAFGMALFIARGGEAAVTGKIDVPPFGQVLAGVLSLEPVAFMVLGIVILLLTPFMRVVGAVVSFVVKKDWRYALISLGVMTILLLGLFVHGLLLMAAGPNV